MNKTYLLIDLQNRQPAPESVAPWIGANGEAWIFYGEHQIGLLAQYMELGDRVSLADTTVSRRAEDKNSTFESVGP